MDKSKCRILIVDDDPFVADMLSLILDGEGYPVETAGNGREALEIHAARPDIGLIISDMNMPVMNGLELIDELRGRGGDTPIIILTGNSEISVAIQALKNGASDYLLKDENIQETISVSVARVLEKRRLEVANRQLTEDLTRKNRELEQERVLAHKIQESILPHCLVFPGFSAATFYRPSDQIGGDFFDAWESGNHLHCLIGDISGHDTSAALLMAVCKGMFSSLGQSLHDPLAVVGAANRLLCPMLIDSGMFLTLVYITYDRESGEMRLLSAGHTTVYLLRGTDLLPFESTGPAIGWDSGDSWEVISAQFEPGDLLFLHTDGVIEAENERGEAFEGHLAETLTACKAAPAEMVPRIVAALENFCNGRFNDDITMLALRREE